MPITRFSSLDLIGAATVNDTGMQFAENKSLILGKAGASGNDAVTYTQLAAVQSELDLVSGTETSYDTLGELQALLASADTAGALALTASINAEKDARIAAITAEKDARVAASNAEKDARIAAIDAEKADRVANDEIIKQGIFIQVHTPLSGGPLGVVPDEAPPIAFTREVRDAAEGVDGWYFTNGGPNSSTRKHNWYLKAPVNQSTGVATVGSLLELSLPAVLLSKLGAPMITLYTKLKESGNQTTWYHSKITWWLSNPSLALQNIGKKVLLQALVSGTTSSTKYLGFTPVQFEVSTQNTKGTMLDTDEILAISVGTDSSAAAGKLNHVISGLFMSSTNDNVFYKLSNVDVQQNLILEKMAQLFHSLQPDDTTFQNLHVF